MAQMPARLLNRAPRGRARASDPTRPFRLSLEITGRTLAATQLRHRELPPLAPIRIAVRCDRLGFIETPRPMRARVTPAVAGLLACG
jgi:hypothetical protein